MAHFSYTAEKSDGEVYKGVAEAKDRFELYTIVRQEGGKIIAVEEEKSNNVWSITYWNARLTTIKEYDKILFARNLGAMLGAGLSLARALSVLERQTKNPRLARVISQVASDVRRGDTLHESMARTGRVFPKLVIAMVRAGEEGGDLPASLAVVADQMERMYDLKKKIRGAMIYPCIILIAIVGIGIVMMIEVVPTLAQTFAEMNAGLPKPTQIVIAISNFLVAHTVMAIGGIIGGVVLITALLRTRAGSRGVDWVLLQLPAIGEIVREINAARTARTLASLNASGVDVLTSLEITREVVQNSFFQAILKEAQEAVGSGAPLSQTFAKHEKLYPAFVGEMMAVGEETGATADMMKRLAAYYEQEVDRKTADMSTIVEPFLMLFIGAAVGFFAVAMIMPIYQLSNNI